AGAVAPGSCICHGRARLQSRRMSTNLEGRHDVSLAKHHAYVKICGGQTCSPVRVANKAAHNSSKCLNGTAERRALPNNSRSNATSQRLPNFPMMSIG